MEKNEKRKYTLESKVSTFDREKAMQNAKGNKYIVEFAYRLCVCLDKNNENESDLARETKIGKASINAYIKAEQIPNIEKLITIAEHFAVSTDYLLGFTNSPSLNEDFKIVHKVTGLSDNSIEILKTYNDLINDDKILQIFKDEATRSHKAIDFLLQNEDTAGIFSYIASYLWDTYQSDTKHIKELKKFSSEELEKLSGDRIILKTTDNRNVSMRTSDINKMHLISIEEILHDLKTNILNKDI